jgi:hypothetical protein
MVAKDAEIELRATAGGLDGELHDAPNVAADPVWRPQAEPAMHRSTMIPNLQKVMGQQG